VVPLLASFSIVVLTVPFIRRYALGRKLGNKPNGRSIHPASIPHLGGVGLTCGIIGALVLAGLLTTEIDGEAWVFLGTAMPGAVFIIGLGFIDDLKSLKAVQKLVVQIAASIILALAGVRFFLGYPPVDTLAPIAFLVTVFYLVGVTNSVNLIDGHDGLAAGICLIASGSLAYLGHNLGAPIAMALSLAVMGACLAFLVFNFPPGKIFMGDTGSLFLGMSLGLVSCSISAIHPSPRTTMAVAFILAVPLLDTTLAVARRLIMRVPIFGADCLHVHHVLRALGFSPRQTIFLLYVLEGSMGGLGVFVFKGYTFPVFLGLALFGFSFVFFLRLMLAPAEVEEKVATRELAQPSMPTLDKTAK